MKYWIFTVLSALISLSADAAGPYLDVSLVREGKTSKIDYRLTKEAQRLLRSAKGPLEVLVNAEPELKKITRLARAEIRAQQSKILLFANGILIDTPKTPEDPCCDGFWNGFWQGLDDTLHGKTLKEDLGAFASGAVFGPILKSLLNNLPHGKLLALGGVIAFSKDFLESKVTGYQTNQKGWSNSFIWGRVVFDFVKELALVTIGMKSSEGLGKLLAKIAKKNPWAKYLIKFFTEAFTPSADTKAKNEAYVEEQKNRYTPDHKKNSPDHDDTRTQFPKPTPNRTPPKPKVPGTPVNRVPATITPKSTGNVVVLERPSVPPPSSGPSILDNNAKPLNIKTVSSPYQDFQKWRQTIDLYSEYKPVFDRIGEVLKNPTALAAPATFNDFLKKDFAFLRSIPGLPTSVRTFASSVPPPDEEPTPLPQPSDYSKFLREALYSGGITLEHLNALQSFYEICRKNKSSDGDCEKARSILRDRKMSKYLEEAYDGQRETHHILALNWHYQRCLDSGNQSPDCLKTKEIFLELAKQSEKAFEWHNPYLNFFTIISRYDGSDQSFMMRLSMACNFFENIVEHAEVDLLLKEALEKSLEALSDRQPEEHAPKWMQEIKNPALVLIHACSNVIHPSGFNILWKLAVIKAAKLEHLTQPTQNPLAIFEKHLWHLSRYIDGLGFEAVYRKLFDSIQQGRWSEEHVMALATLATMTPNRENPVDTLRDFAIETLRHFGITYAREGNSKVVILNNPVAGATSLKGAQDRYKHYLDFQRVLGVLDGLRGEFPKNVIQTAHSLSLNQELNLNDHMEYFQDNKYMLYGNGQEQMWIGRFTIYALAELIARELPERERAFFPAFHHTAAFRSSSTDWFVSEQFTPATTLLDVPKETLAYTAILEYLHGVFNGMLGPEQSRPTFQRVNINRQARFLTNPATSYNLPPLMTWITTYGKPKYGLTEQDLSEAALKIIPIFENDRFTADFFAILKYLGGGIQKLSQYQQRVELLEDWVQRRPLTLKPREPLPASQYSLIPKAEKLPRLLSNRLKTPFYFGSHGVDPADIYLLKNTQALKKILKLVNELEPNLRDYNILQAFKELQNILTYLEYPFSLLFTDRPLTPEVLSELSLDTLVFTITQGDDVPEMIHSLTRDAASNFNQIRLLHNLNFVKPEFFEWVEAFKISFFKGVSTQKPELIRVTKLFWTFFWSQYAFRVRDFVNESYQVSETIKNMMQLQFNTFLREKGFSPEQVNDFAEKCPDVFERFARELELHKETLEKFLKED